MELGVEVRLALLENSQGQDLDSSFVNRATLVNETSSTENWTQQIGSSAIHLSAQRPLVSFL